MNADDRRCITCGTAREDASNSPRCPECREKHERVRQRANKARSQAKPESKRWYRSYYLQRNYGVSQERWDQQFMRQGKTCAVCSSPDPGPRGWHTDHDHSCCPSRPACGSCFRGILCHHCNLMIGLARDDHIRLIAAAEYVQKGSTV